MSSDFRFSPRPNKAGQIAWREWGEEAFQEAQRKNKPLLLSISAVWCHWCHVMDETSYSDDECIRLINQRFIPIRVDNDRRPDINQRYNMGGWPTTAFLTSEGEVLAGATYLPADRFREALAQISDYYAKNRDEVRRKVAEMQAKRQASGPSSAAQTELSSTVAQDVVQAIQSRFDSVYGGFGTEPKFPMVESLELLLEQYVVTKELRLLLMVTKTLDQMRARGIFDQVEGGFFRYSTTKDWDIPHYEKMLEGNAGLLGNCLHAYQVTKDEAYRETAERVIGYLDVALSDPQDGYFYGSQDADEHYYTLSAEERAKLTAPPVDKTLYVNWNALAAARYLQAAWVLGDERYLQRGLRALDFLWEHCRDGAAGMFHFYDGAPHVTGMLTDQISMASGCLDAYEVSGGRQYLDRAVQLGELINRDYKDVGSSGFFDVREEREAVAKLHYRDKGIGENGAVADLFGRLYHLTEKSAYKEAAQSALLAFSEDHQHYGDFAAGYARAWLRLSRPPLQVHIVGEAEREQTRALLWAALRLPELAKAVEVLDPSEDDERLMELGYPSTPSPAAYVCFNGACSAPIEDAAALEGAYQALGQPEKTVAQHPLTLM